MAISPITLILTMPKGMMSLLPARCR